MNFDERLMKAETSDELKKMKIWMFQEQVRIQAKKDELFDLSCELQEERRNLEREKTALQLKEKAVKKRFDENEIFIAKKKKIIEDAYQQLALDRKALECERLNFEHERVKYKRQRMSAGRTAYQHENTGKYTAYEKLHTGQTDAIHLFYKIVNCYDVECKCNGTEQYIDITDVDCGKSFGYAQ